MSRHRRYEEKSEHKKGLILAGELKNSKNSTATSNPKKKGKREKEGTKIYRWPTEQRKKRRNELEERRRRKEGGGWFLGFALFSTSHTQSEGDSCQVTTR